MCSAAGAAVRSNAQAPAFFQLRDLGRGFQRSMAPRPCL